MAGKIVSINRAPVLTLWASVVAERQGFDRNEALSLAKALAGLNAQSKGRHLGIFQPGEKKPVSAPEQERGEAFRIELCGRHLPAVNTAAGIRATLKGKPIDPESVQRYLVAKFGEQLETVRSSMQKLARNYPPEELACVAFDLYERFRPAIPEGVRGWGAKGELDLRLLEKLCDLPR